MSNHWSQFTLKSLFFLAMIVSVYFAGRVPQRDRVRIAEAQSAAAVERSLEFNRLADLWESVALTGRPDLAHELILVRSMWDSRRGIGGSYVGRGPDFGGVRPRFLRWRIKFAVEEAEYLKQLDGLGIKLVAVWTNPPSVQVVSNLSNRASATLAPEIPLNGLILKADHHDYLLVENIGLRKEPRLVLRVLSADIENHFAYAEALHLEEHALKLRDIHRTDFEIRINADDISIVVTACETKADQ